MLKEKILNKQKGLALYGLTPPKAEFDEAKLRDIADRWTARIECANADGLVLYEIQDESARMQGERTFEFSDTLSPQSYYADYLNVATPSIFYRVANKYDESEFRANLAAQSSNLNVFVGAASAKITPKMSLARAYEIAKESFPQLVTGGVCIAERHAKKGDEPQRMREKIRLGAKFFISQAIFDADLARKFLADCAAAEISEPIFLTFSTAGNPKTLEFIKWLGVSVPGSIEARLNASEDYLAKSCEIIKEIWCELKDFGDKNGLNLSVNIESVMAKRAEIEASLALVKEIRQI